MKSFESDLTVKDLFKELLYRIPDYQRGYSWDKIQLEELWEDLENLKEAKEHYVGLITVTEDETQGEDWTGFGAQSIIDGQQRLTTLVILMKSILDKASDLSLKELDNLPIHDLIQKYLYKEHANNPKVKASILGYSEDDPSDEYLKCNVLGIKEYPQAAIQTAYTKRMKLAQEYFSDQVKEFDKEKLENLFKTVTNKLVFNKYNVVGDREVSMIFESMNNRGKKLSTLELLKNRLMYISEKLPEKEEVRTELREKVKKAWKIIYEWLGKDELMDDDEFLRAHWIMYYNYERSKSSAYANDLLNVIFPIKKIYDKKKKLTYSDISDYSVSLSNAVKHWYYINYPEKAVNTYNGKIIDELARLNRIGSTSFRPMIMANLMHNKGKNDVEKFVELMRKCEEYIFKIFGLSGKQSNTGDSHFYRLAKQYYEKKINVDDLISSIDDWIKGNYRIQTFYETIDKFFEENEGFYSWGYIDYFLFEYDLYLKEHSRGATGKVIDWNEYDTYKKDYVSIEHIYPQTDSRDCWKKTFGHFSEDHREILKHTLGNLLPLSTKRNASFQNKCFEKKKDDGNGNGYYLGSFSEAEVSRNKDWKAFDILERGEKLLSFMENRWGITIENKKELLHLNFLK